MQGSLQDRRLDRHCSQLAAFDLVAEQAIGKDRTTPVMDDHLALEIHGLDFQRDLEYQALLLRGALDELAKNLKAIVQDKRKLSEPAECNSVLELRKHIGGADEEQ